MLLASLPESARPDNRLVDVAKALDKHYILTRYPNGFERGAPTTSTRTTRPRWPSGTPRRSLSTVVVKSVDEGAVRRAMDAYADWLLDHHPPVEEVIVFGSFERGTWAPGSDLDVFVVLSSADRPVHERVTQLLPGAFPVGLDLFPFTADEIQERRPSPLLDAVDASGWRYRRPAARYNEAYMSVDERRRRATTRVTRLHEDRSAFDREFWHAMSPDARLEALWDLTLDFLTLSGEGGDQPRLQRSVCRIERGGR